MQQTWSGLALAAILAGAGTSVTAQTIQKPSLSLDGARRAIAAAKAEAAAKQAPGAVIAVVDDGGNLMALERLDGTFAAGATISIGKARTAALFKKPTRVFEDLINKGRTAMAAIDFTPLQGGVPIVSGGTIVGAIGVSGAASAQQDEELAMAGAAALEGAPTTAAAPAALPPADADGVVYIAAATVADGFRKGMPLVETGAWKIHASRRERDGQAEVHTRDTDILYVLDGTATLVTGGQVVAGTPLAADEIRGEAIRSGRSRALVKGDVVVVPNGVPHLFKDVKAPFLYYVVKVTAGKGLS